MTELFARLDRTGWFVLCAYIDCGTRITEVSPIGERAVMLGPGWKQEESGTWRLTPHAQRRFDAGHAPRDRRRALSPGAAAAKELRGTPKEDRYQEPPLPAYVVCPRCRHTETLDADRLRAQAMPKLPVLTTTRKFIDRRRSDRGPSC